MKKYAVDTFPHILHGGDYNPDQWQDCPEVLAEDMRLMKLANCNEMSLGIFSWSTLEPEEGRFDFSFLDKAMDDIYNAGGRVILATPSGARPAWMAQKYPEVLRVRDDGIRNEFGVRHNHCYTSPVYREKVRILDEKLAERYADHPALIAWHISNEYGGECHCPLCRAEFRKWLRKKYGTLEKLNHEWWTKFWSHTFTDWEQIVPPGPLGDTGLHGLTLDWKRFVTYQTTDFMKAEINAVRKYSHGIPITSNLMGFYPGLDYRELSKELDFVSWDNYPEWQTNNNDIRTAQFAAMTHDLMRSLKMQPFLMMESTPSCVNWHSYNKLKRPGVNELSSMQAIAHGSDSVLYFQWRKSRGSSEKFHGAVVDHEGTENTRVFREVAGLGKRLKKLDEIVGTVTVSDVAILYDWDNRWALEDAQGFSNQDKKYLQTLTNYYGAFWQKGIDVDMIGREDDFSKYKLIIAPMQYMIPEKTGEKLRAFVSGGGTVYFTYMTAMVNENDLCHLGGFPGAGLKDVCGLWNEEIDTLYPGESNTVRHRNGNEYTAADYCEIIHLNGAVSLAEYKEDFYAGSPAFTVNSYGEGKTYYQAFRDDGTFFGDVIAKILADCKIGCPLDGELPYGVTVHSRTDGETTYVFVQNFTNTEKLVEIQAGWHNVENGEGVTGDISINPYFTSRGKAFETQVGWRNVESNEQLTGDIHIKPYGTVILNGRNPCDET